VDAYYYLMAQLPGIVPGQPLQITYADFSERAARFLSETDLAILGQIATVPSPDPCVTGSTVFDGFYGREKAMLFSLERIRAARLGRDYAFSAYAEDVIAAYPEATRVALLAADMDDPLEAERLLDRARLGFIDDLSAGHFFDAEAVFAYGIKVLILEREGHFKEDEGRASYTAIYNQILGEYA
jgi:hypothetical protein